MTPLERMKAMAAIENKILIDKTGKLNYGVYKNKAGGCTPKAERKDT